MEFGCKVHNLFMKEQQVRDDDGDAAIMRVLISSYACFCWTYLVLSCHVTILTQQ